MSLDYTPLAPAPTDNNQGLIRLLVRVPPHIRDAFTTEQIEALAWATSSVETRHHMARRLSFRLLGRNYYVALFFGRCRRYRPGPLGRFIARGLEYSLPYRAIKYSVLTSVAVAGSLTLIAAAYMAKSSLGIDLSDEPSALHDILYRGDAGSGQQPAASQPDDSQSPEEASP